MIPRLKMAFSPLIFYVIDLLISTVSLGFYDFYFHFDLNKLYTVFLNLDLRQSGFEFIVCVFLRLLIVTIGMVLLVKKREISKFDTGFSFFTPFVISYSLAKILLFAEIDGQLNFFGLWMNVIWNIVASLSILYIWHNNVKTVSLVFNDYQRMENGETENENEASESSSSSGSSSYGLTSSDDSENDLSMPRLSTFQHIKQLVAYCGRHWFWFLSGVVSLILASIPKILLPYYVGQIVSDIMSQSQGKESHFFYNILIMSGLGVISTIFSGFRGAAFTQAEGLVSQSVRKDLFRSLVKQEIAFFDTHQTGALLSRLTTDCEKVTEKIANFLNYFLLNMTIALGSFFFMFQLSWKLGLVTFIAIAPIMMISKYYGEYYDRLGEQTQETMADANLMAEEVLGSMRTVRAFACEDFEANKYSKRLAETMKCFKTKAIYALLYDWTVEILNNFVLIIILLYASHLAIKGYITANVATSFVLYQIQINENFFYLSYILSTVMESVGSSRKILEFIHREPKIKNNGENDQEVKGCVEIKDVSFSYPSREQTNVLNSLSLRIEPGETAALVGPSGAGKSSIIALLEHFYTVKAGAIKLDGVDIKDYAHKYYHQQVSLVSQEPVLYSGSVRENILYGLEENYTEEDMIQAAKLANAHDFIMEMQDGYETKCGEKGVQMSGGQKQRIAIARALVRKPAVLILDEATSALDTESEYIIQKALQQCSVGRTVIIIAHRLSTVEKADKIFVIDKGKLVQSGTHGSLMEEDGMYKNLVQRQLLSNEKEGKSNNASSSTLV